MLLHIISKVPLAELGGAGWRSRVRSGALRHCRMRQHFRHFGALL